MRPIVSPEWIFDPVLASGRRSGGDPTSYIFPSSLDTFVREVLQNANDQSRHTGPVHVSFDFYHLTGAHLSRLLAAIQWEELSTHLAAVASTPSLVAGRVRRALETADDELLVLRIQDSGTWGLEGDEDDHASNFNALCRDVLVTTEERAARGGSHGLGKAVLWGASSLSTVMFSSRIKDNGGTKFRLFGRTDLPYHEVNGNEWDGAGFFGRRMQTRRGGDRAESLWDADAIATASAALLDRRQVGDGTGTTLMILGFTEKEQEQPREASIVAADILNSAIRWFWPSICSASLVVTASAHDNDELVFQGETEISPEVKPFVEMIEAQDVADTATEPDQVAERPLHIRVPARQATRTSAGAPETEGLAILRLVRASAADAENPQLSRVALVRGAGMVVRYWKPTQLPLEGEGFFAVLQAGLAAGESAGEEAVDAFLRAAEPPAHDNWVHWTNQIDSTYPRGSKARLDELWGKLTQRVLDMCRTEPPAHERGPQDLARLFPIGGWGGGTTEPRSFSVLFDDYSLDPEGVWSVSGRIRRIRGSAPWAAICEVRLEGETGRGDRLELSSLSVPAAEVTVVNRGHNTAEITVPADLDEVSFEIRAVATDEPIEIVRRTRIRAHIRPRILIETGS